MPKKIGAQTRAGFLFAQTSAAPDKVPVTSEGISYSTLKGHQEIDLLSGFFYFSIKGYL